MLKSLRKIIIDHIVDDLNNCGEEKFANYFETFMSDCFKEDKKSDFQEVRNKKIPPTPKLEGPRLYKGI